MNTYGLYLISDLNPNRHLRFGRLFVFYCRLAVCFFAGIASYACEKADDNPIDKKTTIQPALNDF